MNIEVASIQPREQPLYISEQRSRPSRYVQRSLHLPSHFLHRRSPPSSSPPHTLHRPKPLKHPPRIPLPLHLHQIPQILPPISPHTLLSQLRIHVPGIRTIIHAQNETLHEAIETIGESFYLGVYFFGEREEVDEVGL